MASCNSWQYLVTILAKIFPRSWQDLAKILLRYPWRVDPGRNILSKALYPSLYLNYIAFYYGGGGGSKTGVFHRNVLRIFLKTALFEPQI